MEIKVKLNGKNVIGNVEADTVLLDWLREKGCLSVKRGCDTSNCGLCTVFMDNKPILSCSKLAVQADGHEIKTLEGLQEEALEFVGFIADQGADQCGFCNPGFVMNTIALLRENQDPTDDEIRAFLAGNLCRCLSSNLSLITRHKPHQVDDASFGHNLHLVQRNLAVADNRSSNPGCKE